MGSVEPLLRELGPSVSPKIIEEIARREGIKESSARKRLNRAVKNSSSKVSRLENISFSHNWKFYYLEDQKDHEAYWDALKSNLVGTAYGMGVDAILSRGGAISERLFHIFSGSPHKEIAKHPRSQEILNDLQEDGLVEIEDEEADETETTVRLNTDSTVLYDPEYREARIESEKIILEGLKIWLQKTAFVSHDKIRTRYDDTSPSFGSFRWDLSAPSYLLPLKDREHNGELKPGFVVGDVTYSVLNKQNVKYFVKKCEAIENQQNSRPFLPILLARWFTEDAHQYGKKKGVQVTTPEAFFGDDVAEALQKTTELYRAPERFLSKGKEHVSEILNSLGAIGINVPNLKGDLFEMIAFACVSKGPGGFVEHSRKVRVEKERETDGEGEDEVSEAEIDVLERTSQSLIFYECKAHESLIGYDTVESWFEKKRPIMMKWARDQDPYRSLDLKFEFWTTSNFRPDAREFLEEHQDPNGFDIEWREEEEVREMAKEKVGGALEDVLEEHFFSSLDLDETEDSPDLPSGLGNVLMDEFNLEPSKRVGELKSKVSEGIEDGKIPEGETAHFYVEWLRRIGVASKEPVKTSESG